MGSRCLLPLLPTGFQAVPLTTGWAIDNMFNLPGGNTGGSTFTCPAGASITGFSGAAVYYPNGWLVDLKLRCSGDRGGYAWLMN